MRDDAVLGRALPLDRGLGPFTYYKIQAYKGHVKHSKAQFNFRASEAQLVAFYNYYCYSFSSYYYYHFYNYHYALSDNKL